MCSRDRDAGFVVTGRDVKILTDVPRRKEFYLCDLSLPHVLGLRVLMNIYAVKKASHNDDRYGNIYHIS